VLRDLANRPATIRVCAGDVLESGTSRFALNMLDGSPATVADELEGWIDDTDLDGFNLAFVVRPETFIDVVDLLVPELQRRNRYKRAYSNGTLREKLFGNPRLGGEHPAASYRWS
jgi:hypothetical protein